MLLFFPRYALLIQGNNFSYRNQNGTETPLIRHTVSAFQIMNIKQAKSHNMNTKCIYIMAFYRLFVCRVFN